MYLLIKKLNLDYNTNKTILNTTGVIKDLNDELIDFFRYVEYLNSKVAEESNGSLVRNIHKKVIEIKNNQDVEVAFMTLLERNKEKIKEGRQEEKLEIAKI